MSTYISSVTNSNRGDLHAFVAQTLAATPGDGARRVPFIENKSPDLADLDSLLELSKESGRWTNFGPVSALLETALERYLNVHPARAVVMCSSGTAALATLVAIKNYRAGRRLRWVVSAYGFRSTCLGALADARILDCNERGMLDLDALAALNPDLWDGVVVTNVFGLATNVQDYVRLCRHLGKELILDNAGLLDGFPRQDPACRLHELLSFHHTKPWGMGEGGCAILPRSEAQLFRQFTNLGKGLDAAAHPGASNCKISDFSCALILQRLLRAPQWSLCYRMEAGRILAIAQDVGLEPLAPFDLYRLTPAHLPLLARNSIPQSALENPTMALQKYYPPLTRSAPRARNIFGRIVNVPCHPDMAALTDSEIRDCLAGLSSRRV